MAFINKLFSRKKANVRRQDNVCEKLFAFSNDQVRVVLFQECDFRGRKLLFDSSSIRKVPLSDIDGKLEAFGEKTKLKEKCNGFGYVCNKPKSDTSLLGEMVFGSVAMSYRGASYKIHSLNNPSRLMCTKVFPSPRHPRGTRCSAPTQTSSTQSLDKSMRLDDSSSLSYSSDPSSGRSTVSDTLLVCRGISSAPLDVPTLGNSSWWSNIPRNENIGDSGCGVDLSYSSNGSSSGGNVPSDGATNGTKSTFSSGSLYKRCLRSASTSLDYSINSLTGSASADECIIRPNNRTIKLGLAVIVELTQGQEENMELFFMEHAALIESMVSRARQGTELAYMRYANFLSLMVDVANNASQWLVDMLSGPQLRTNLWLSLLSNCDTLNSINKPQNGAKLLVNSDKSDETPAANDRRTSFLLSLSEHHGLRDNKEDDFSFFNLSRFFKNEESTFEYKNVKNNTAIAEKFIKDLCELLEEIDVKQTHFFFSTLITAVLTHHLGWVSTAMPPDETEKALFTKLVRSNNPLWGQLTDLFGATGHPTKVAHTIINGANKNDLIMRILNVLTYFIRCNEVERKNFVRSNIEEENEEAFKICQKSGCIPKESYKKYEDHLREIGVVNGQFIKITPTTPKEVDKLEINQEEIQKENKEKMQNKDEVDFGKGLKKTATCLKDLKQLVDEAEVLEFKKDIDVDAEGLNLNLSVVQFKKPQFNPTNSELFFQFPDPVSIDDDKMEIIDNFSLVQAPELSKVTSTIDLKKLAEPLEKSPSPLCYDNITGKEVKLTEFTTKKLRRQSKNFNFIGDLSKYGSLDVEETVKEKEKAVIFVLGDNDELVNIKKEDNRLKNKEIEGKNITKQEESNFSIDLSEKQCFSLRKTQSSINLQQELIKADVNNKESEVTNCFNETITKLYEERADFEDNLDKTIKDETNNWLKSQDFSSSNCKLKKKPPSLNLHQSIDSKPNRPTTLNIGKNYNSINQSSFYISDSPETPKNFFKNSVFKDEDFIKCNDVEIKPSTSYTTLPCLDDVGAMCKKPSVKVKDVKLNSEIKRCQSEPPEDKDKECPPKETKAKYRYSGVKFNFQQYPQVLPNYMRSKNIELANLPFSFEKAMSFQKLSTEYNVPALEPSDYEEVEALQTPSNASELEYVSELDTQGPSHIKNRNCSIENDNSKSAQENKTNLLELENKSCKISVLLNESAIDEIENENALKCKIGADTVDIVIKNNNEITVEKENVMEGIIKNENDACLKVGTQNALDCIEVKSEDSSLKESHSKLLLVVKSTVQDDVNGKNEKSLKNSFELRKQYSFSKSFSVTSPNDKLSIVELPMPKVIEEPPYASFPPGYTSSLMRGVHERYISDMVLQGTIAPKNEWESLLKRDLVLTTRYPLLDQPVQEAVAIVANTDAWEVQLISSHTYVTDRGSLGVRVGMSQLVANMLESLLSLWKANMPPEYCLLHIEQCLQEFCLQSKAMAQMLLETDFCSMDLLTKALQLEVNDVPLLMAVASTHSPELLQKYGLSFS